MPAPPPQPAARPLVPGAIVPGPPGGVLDLAALAEIEDRLRVIATESIESATRRGEVGRQVADQRRSLTSAASSVATVLWFDSLRTEDRVSVTPHAAPLLAAVHQVLEASRPADADADADAAAAELVTDSLAQDAGGPPEPASPVRREPWGTRLPLPTGPSARALRATGAGTVGPSGTVWGALARRLAGARFDHAPGGRAVCILRYPELRDAAVWEAVTDERTPYLGELLWVVLVTGAAVGAEAEGVERAGLSGPAGPDRAARMFEAAGWQVLTLRYGRRLAGLFRRPGGQAFRGRLARMSQDEYRELLVTRGPELRRRLAGPGAAGAGIAGLVDTLTDDEIHAALRDLGGHDLALLIDAVDDVATDRPTVLFAHTHDAWTRDPDVHEVPARAPRAEAPAAGVRSIHPMSAGAVVVPAARNAGTAGSGQLAPPAGSRGARLATHVASYLDQAPPPAPDPPALPVDLDPIDGGTWAGESEARPGEPGAVLSSTQASFGALLRGLAGLAPRAAGAVVTISTRDADTVVAGWLDPTTSRDTANHELRGPRGPDEPTKATGPDGPDGPGQPRDADGAAAGPAGAPLVSSGGRRHVAGAFPAGAFTGVLGNLAVAWNRQGLPLLPIGVTDELAAGRVVPAWAAGCAVDGRSVLAVADTGAGGRFAGPTLALALAATGVTGLPGVTRYEPAFAQDLAWCLLAALARLGRADGSSSLLRLSARTVDQRLAAVPAAGPARARRQAAVLAGGYRLRDGGPAPALTLVAMGPVLPEVLAAADELEAELGAGVGVAVATSADLLFAALRARDAHLRRAGEVGHAVAGGLHGVVADGAGPRDSGPRDSGPRDSGPAETGPQETGTNRSWVLEEMFPAWARAPLVTVVNGDPSQLGFLAGVRGDRLAAVGPTAATDGPTAAADQASPGGPVEVAAIVGAARRLLTAAGGAAG
ncbi:pyruvate dehydrogenase [Pseudofrankia sp. BMG5.37]|uniref:pyruvate dehydrogenase n=1 Tax=Pseudofrankia sp. BMG5.37 TaxID=3050035 RepID=UPI002894A878|nr:pyruvate dehydrogenase [Pseudofrankia sp. BMG5.37]MDT3442045.1 pyruvate dehydrogenase [Pseudofrankia sp. BMG5.37]